METGRFRVKMGVFKDQGWRRVSRYNLRWEELDLDPTSPLATCALQ